MGEKKPLTGTQRFIALVTVLALAVYSVISIALASNAYGKLSTNVDELQDVATNWLSGTILDIQVVNGNCPTNYVSAFNDRGWGGINAGCWCGKAKQADLNKYNITCSPFCSGTCSADAIKANCSDVAPRSGQVLNYYSTMSSQNYQVCIQRSAENWVEAAFISSSNCSAGYRSCGTGENRFCTKQSKCPITKIEVVEKTTAIATEVTNCQASVFTDTDGNTFKNCAVLANNGVKLKLLKWYRQDGGVLPLSQLTLNQYSMCRLKGTDNVDPTRKNFYLYAGQTTSCGLEGMSRWNQTDTVNEEDLFIANNLKTYIDTLKPYTESGMLNGYYPTGKSGQDYLYGMFTRGYIPFKISCRERLKSLLEKQTFVDNLKKAQLALLIISVVSVVFLGLPLAYMEIQNLRGEDLPCIAGKGEEERTKLRRFRKIVNYIFKTVQLPFQIWAISSSASARGLLLDLSDENCSNADTNAVLIFIANTLNSTYKSTIASIAILVSTLLLDILLDCWSRRKAKQEAAKPKAVSPGTDRDEQIQLASLENNSSTSPIKFGSPTTNRPANMNQNSPPAQTQAQTQAQAQAQPQTQATGPNIVIQIQPGQMNMPQQQYPPQQYPPQQYPPQQYPPQQQGYPQQGYPQQQYPPQQYPPQQYPPQQQGYPQQQYAPQQYPPQQYPPQQQGYPQQQYPQGY